MYELYEVWLIDVAPLVSAGISGFLKRKSRFNWKHWEAPKLYIVGLGHHIRAYMFMKVKISFNRT